MLKRYRRRWGDNDHYWGPFTYAYDKHWRPLVMALDSGSEEYPGCSLKLRAFGHTLIVGLPPIIKPDRWWKDLSNVEWAKKDGVSGYWEIHEREYGFSCSDGFFQLFFGRQTDDSSTEQRWGKFLPWTQWRAVRHSLYDEAGRHYADMPDIGVRYTEGRWERDRAIKDGCPVVKFTFEDYDGEVLVATTRIEEGEHWLGVGWFRWLAWFAKARLYRSLDISFSDETGERKGSWKGGVLSTGIEMLPGELHEAAFRRYCAANKMTFLGHGELM